MKSHEYYYLAKKNLLPDASERGRIEGFIKKGDRVHVSAVCGKAMASVACLLQEYGCSVTGSDMAFHPPMSGVLTAHGIKCLPPSRENLEDIDIVVVGNLLAHNSLEIVEAREKNIPMISGAEALGQIFKNKRALVVTGTHGKTTVSGLLTHVFIEAKEDPAYLIGGVFQKSDNSYSMGGEKSRFVIYEGDEYNCAFFDRGPKFLRYNPTSAILTSIEQDHVDLYTTFEDYKQAFQFLVDELPQGGFLVVHESALPFINTQEAKAKVIVYGASPSCDAYYEIEKTDEEGTLFSLNIKGQEKVSSIRIPLFGEYNVSNAVAVFMLALSEGLSKENIINALKTFAGTKERQELLGTRKDGVVVIRDYAHHPTAVALTLEGIKLRYPNRKLVAVFEPRSASSKRKVFEERYGESLSNADSVILICPLLKDEGENKDLFDALKVKAFIESQGKKAYNASSSSEALQALPQIANSSEVVVFMSTGDMENIPAKFLEL